MDQGPDKYQLTLDVFNRNASAYQDKFMDLDLYNDTYDHFCSLIRKLYPKIFEIGCGPGNITRYILSKRPDFSITAIDLAPGMIELARKNITDARFEVMDCRSIDQIKDRFDGIICGFCMPYLSKEECIKLIHDSYELLNERGVMYFSVIEDDYSKSGYELTSDGKSRYHLFYHQQDYLEQAVNEAGFSELNLYRKIYREKEESTHLIFIAVK